MFVKVSQNQFEKYFKKICIKACLLNLKGQYLNCQTGQTKFFEIRGNHFTRYGKDCLTFRVENSESVYYVEPFKGKVL